MLFSALQSHYLFRDRYGRPGKGNDKGKVEGIVGYARRSQRRTVRLSESDTRSDRPRTPQ